MSFGLMNPWLINTDILITFLFAFLAFFEYRDEAKFASTLAVQEPGPQQWCNANAILLLVIASFFWGLYAV